MRTILSPWISDRERHYMKPAEVVHLHVFQENYDRLIDKPRRNPRDGPRTIADRINAAYHLLWDVVEAPSLFTMERADHFDAVRVKYAKSALCMLRRKMLAHLLQPKKTWDVYPHQLAWKPFTEAQCTPLDANDLVQIHPCQARTLLNRLYRLGDGDFRCLDQMVGVLRWCACLPGTLRVIYMDDKADVEGLKFTKSTQGVPVDLPNDRWRAELMRSADLAMKIATLYLMEVFQVEDEKKFWIG